MNPILRTILAEWRERSLPSMVERETPLVIEEKPVLHKATVVTGFRRTGKTYLCLAAIKKLLKKYRREEVVYINFEDERMPLKTEILSALLPEIEAFYGQKPRFLFLDEVQNMPLWSKWLRRILDTEKIEIIATGSSSKMSSFELPTELRGRSWEKKVFPLNFNEFCRFKKVGPFLHFQQLFEEYLVFGGLPEVVLTPNEKKLELLQLYFQTVVRKEIMERHHLQNEATLKTSLSLMLNSTYLTISKLTNSLKSLGYSLSKNTVSAYLAAAQSAYFYQPLFYFSPSMKNQLQYPRKTYFIDNGFLTALSTKFSKNYGRLLENLIFNLLKQQNKEVFYWRGDLGREIDFAIMEQQKVKTLIQVCFDLTDFETREREVKNLVRAGKKLKCDDLRLIGSPEELVKEEKIKTFPLSEIQAGIS